MTQKETTSGKKIAKKAHRLYRREMKAEAEELGRLVGNMLKPKPKWVPWRIWMLGLGIFIKIKK